VRRKNITCPKPSAQQTRSKPRNIMPVHGAGCSLKVKELQGFPRSAGQRPHPS